jgi:hypothetical protein
MMSLCKLLPYILLHIAKGHIYLLLLILLTWYDDWVRLVYGTGGILIRRNNIVSGLSPKIWVLWLLAYPLLTDVVLLIHFIFIINYSIF